MWLVLHDARDATGSHPLGSLVKRRYWPIFCTIIAAVAVGIALQYSDDFAENARLLFFVQTFAGNWDKDRPADLSTIWFVISATIALALNLGAIAALLSILRTVGSIKRKETMNVVTLLSVRDTLVRDRLFALLESRFPGFQPNDWKEDIRGAFESATKTWAEKSLPELVGRGTTHEVLELLNKQVPS